MATMLKLKLCPPSGTSSAVVPPVGTYVQVLFAALFRDAPVACTGNGAERSWCLSRGDTLFVLAFGLRLFLLLPCIGDAG